MTQSQEALKYLQRDDLGKVIAKGLASVYSHRPERPIKYLAEWLKSYSKTKKQLSKVTQLQKTKSQSLSLFQETNKLNLLKQEQQNNRKKESDKKIEQFKKMIEKHEYQQQLLLEIFPEFIQKRTNITGAYIGQLNHPPRQVTQQDTDELAHLNTGSEKVINYIGSSVSHKNLIRGKMLKLNQGVTGKVFALNEEDPNPQVGEDGQQLPKQPKQKYIYIPNVVKNQNMHYFKIPKLGAYLAAPLVAESFLVQRIFDQVLQEKKKRMSQKQQFDKKKVEDLQQLNKNKQQIHKKIHEMRQKHVDEAQVQPLNNQVQEIENKIKEKQSQSYQQEEFALNSVKRSYVFCVDNLGKDQQLNPKDIEFICSLVEHFKESWQKKQKQLLFKDIETQISYLQSLPLAPATIKQQLQKTSQIDQQKLKEFQQLQDENLRNYKQEQQQFNRKKQQIKNNIMYLDSFLKLKQFRVVKFKDVIQSILFFLGQKKSSINTPHRATLNWKSVKEQYITKDVFNKILNYVVEGPKQNTFNFYSKTPLLLTIFDKFNEEQIFDYNVGLGGIVKFIKKALKHRISNVQLRKNQREIERKERQVLIQENEKLEVQKAEELKEHKNNLAPEQVQGFKQEEWIQKFDKQHPKHDVPPEIVDDIDNDM